MELTTLVTKIWECLPILTVLKKSPGATVFAEHPSDAKTKYKRPREENDWPKESQGQRQIERREDTMSTKNWLLMVPGSLSAQLSQFGSDS